MSHLLQMRGLKLRVDHDTTTVFVASFTDAWIETLVAFFVVMKVLSHLLQMRGLKL